MKLFDFFSCAEVKTKSLERTQSYWKLLFGPKKAGKNDPFSSNRNFSLYLEYNVFCTSTYFLGFHKGIFKWKKEQSILNLAILLLHSAKFIKKSLDC